MEWLYFLLGFIAFPVVALILMKIIAQFTGNYVGPFALFPKVYPSHIDSYMDIQPIIKNFVSKGKDNSNFFILSKNPKFKIIVIKRIYKQKEPTLTLEIRNSDSNKTHFSSVKSKIVSSKIKFSERFTPRLKQPKDIRIKFEMKSIIETAAVSNMIKMVYETINTNISEGLFVSDQDPIFWKGFNS